MGFLRRLSCPHLNWFDDEEVSNWPFVPAPWEKWQYCPRCGKRRLFRIDRLPINYSIH